MNAADSVAAARETVASNSVPKTVESNRWRQCDKYAEKPNDVNDKNY